MKKCSTSNNINEIRTKIIAVIGTGSRVPPQYQTLLMFSGENSRPRVNMMKKTPISASVSICTGELRTLAPDGPRMTPQTIWPNMTGTLNCEHARLSKVERPVM